MNNPLGDLRIRHRRMPELVAQKLRAMIVRGEIAHDSFLPSEAELIKQFGVSRPSIREALRILEAQSLVQVVRGPRGGAKVSAPSIEAAAHYTGLVLQSRHVPLSDISTMRKLIEPPLVHMLAQKRPKKTAAALRAVLREEQAVGGDIEKFMLLTRRFDEELIAQTGVQTLVALMQMIDRIHHRHIWLVVQAATEVRDPQDIIDRSLEVHVRMVELIAAGAADAARDQWAEWLDRLYTKLNRWEQFQQVIDVLD